MKKALYILASTTLLTSCGDNKSEETARPEVMVEEAVVEQTPIYAPTTSYLYTVINKQESSMPLPDNQELKKMTYTVEIPSEYSQSALSEIADVIKHEDNHEYVFVEYYLPSQPKTGPNYGIAKRTPSENSVTVNYVASPAPEPVAAKAPYDGCKIYGKWSMTGATVIAYQKNGKCYMVNHYGDSNYGDPERFIKTTYRGRTAFKNAEDPADMYVINSNGDLDGYYEGDLASTFPQTY